MKKMLCLLLSVCLMVCVLSACRKKNEKVEQGNQNPVLTQAQTLIGEQKYQEAYDLLIGVEEPSEEEEKLLGCFGFRMLEMSDSNGNKMVYTYDQHGNPLTEEMTASDGSWHKAVATYDKDGNILTSDATGSDGNYENHKYTYDAAGNRLSDEMEQYYDFDGYLEEIYTYTYDANGNLIKEVCTSGDQSDIKTYTYDQDGNKSSEEYQGSLGNWSKYTYDSNGNVLSKEGRNINGQMNKTVYNYDQYGNKTLEEYTSSNGEPYHYAWIYSYDSNGNILTCDYQENKIATSKEVYSYDANGNMLHHKWSRASGDYSWEYIYTYDESGNKLTQEYSDAYGSSEKYTYTYNAMGKLLSEELLRNGYIVYTQSYTYDSEGNLMEEKSVSDDEICIRSYDKDGNVLTYETKYTDGELEKYVCTYDSYGNRLTLEFSDGEETVKETYSYQLYYNPNGLQEIHYEDSLPDENR